MLVRFGKWRGRVEPPVFGTGRAGKWSEFAQMPLEIERDLSTVLAQGPYQLSSCFFYLFD
jgi:hypothetical protein